MGHASSRIFDAETFRVWLRNLPPPDENARAVAGNRQEQLTKPRGSLGRLEDVALWLAGWQGRPRPRLDSVTTVIFAGNHGVAARSVSAFPSAVTTQMVANFAAGGAAINQLSRAFGAGLRIITLDLDRPTADFTGAPAMTEQECAEALSQGTKAVPSPCDLLLVGEMGIGNTTAAAALACVLFGGAADDWAGPGTGLDREGVHRKADVIDAALCLHGSAAGDPFEALRRLGGREIAAMAGAILAARLRRIPVLLDGFVCTAAAAVLHAANAESLDHCLAGHRSAEPAHARLLGILRKEPLLDLGMRLGEASGAAVALAILRAAVAVHNGMATFDEAGVNRDLPESTLSALEGGEGGLPKSPTLPKSIPRP